MGVQGPPWEGSLRGVPRGGSRGGPRGAPGGPGGAPGAVHFRGGTESISSTNICPDWESY